MTSPELTGSMSVITDYWYQQLTDNQVALGLKAVYYGDQATIPFSPALCLEPATKTSELRAGQAGRRVDNEINLSAIIYFGPVSSDQLNLRESLVLAEFVENFFNTDRTCGGLVIHCYVTNLDAGYIERGSVLMRASRLTLEHKTYTVLPS